VTFVLIFCASLSEGADGPSPVVLCHQSAWQQRMLIRYGDVCLVDATYNVTVYGMPLLAFCVCTNVGYVVVATFLLTDESSASIASAVQQLAKWNPNWKPKYFMSDYSEGQITALESVFPGVYSSPLMAAALQLSTT
jgi:MULE transposase domain